jgi:hypothetical protein
LEISGFLVFFRRVVLAPAALSCQQKLSLQKTRSKRQHDRVDAARFQPASRFDRVHFASWVEIRFSTLSENSTDRE